MKIRRWIAAAMAIVVVSGASSLATPAAPAGAAGMTTHAWMAESAIDLVSDPVLKALLQANLVQVRAGARFPDGGYGPGNVYGEEAHWQRFFDIHADRIRDKQSCGDLTAPTGPCAAQIAHLLGAVGHGTGDEVWDWLFEPNSPDLDEYFDHPDLAGFNDHGGQETVMDIVAIGLHHRPGGAPPALPFPNEILASLQQAGVQGVTADQLAVGQVFIDIAYAAETAWASKHLDGVMAAMPWMSHNIVTAPGGVQYAAQAIAGQWDDMWARLKGEDPTSEISATYPADGQRRIPATGWVRTYQPGSHEGRGGARTRIAASVTYALPYRHVGGEPIPSDALPGGSVTITERDTATPVALMSGYPRVVPYGPDSGTHTIDVQPAADLTPCTWYRVDTTALLLDADGQPVTPHSWEFRTGADGTGARCPDDPFTPDELWIRAAYDDVLARTPGDGEVTSWTDQRDRGLTNGRFAHNLVSSAESRRLDAASLYTRYLERSPDAAGLAYWADQLRTVSLTTVRARALGTAEMYAQLGGTNELYVEEIYEIGLLRDATTEDIEYWSGRIAAGLGRGTFAKMLLASDEATTLLIYAQYNRLLDRQPSAGDIAFWLPKVKAADERALIKGIIASPEYVQRATD